MTDHEAFILNGIVATHDPAFPFDCDPDRVMAALEGIPADAIPKDRRRLARYARYSAYAVADGDINGFIAWLPRKLAKALHESIRRQWLHDAGPSLN